VANPKAKRKLRPLPAAEASYTVDPLSDLVSGHELRVWRSHPSTKKVLRYLARWRSQLVDRLAEGESTEPSAEATAMRTVEFVAKAQLLRDILTLEPRDVAQFYGLPEPKEGR
jgi:hypothetical protein